MKPLLKSGATILLTPDTGWNWNGWDGQLKVFSNSKPFHISNDNVILESDVPLFTLLMARSYTAMGFSDIPGIIAMAKFTVDDPTLSKKIRVSNSAPLLISTTGKFTCTYMIPSQKIVAVGTIPDPLATKTGTWKVVDPNQQIVLKIPKGTCIDERVRDMLHSEKMEAAIGQSNISESVLNELGGAAGIVKSLAIGGGLLVAFALIPGGAIVEAVGAGLLLIGAAMSGYEIGQGLAKLKDFYVDTENAKSCEELKNAGKSFGDGIAAVGIGTISAVLSVLRSGKIDKVRLKRGKILSKINQTAQDRHIVGAKYDPKGGRSILTADPQELMNGIKNGKYKIIRDIEGKSWVDFGKEIGIHYKDGKLVGPSNYGIVHYGKDGSHIIPANPVQIIK